MAAKLLLLFVSLLCAFSHIDGRVYERCELARELLARGVSRALVSSWVGIALYESSYNTAAVGPPNTDGSRDWGIFQINDRYWCDPQDGRQSANVCNVACSELLTDDIGKSLHCAQKVWQAQGFSAWSVWNTRCGGGRNLPNVDDCFDCFRRAY